MSEERKTIILWVMAGLVFTGLYGVYWARDTPPPEMLVQIVKEANTPEKEKGMLEKAKEVILAAPAAVLNKAVEIYTDLRNDGLTEAAKKQAEEVAAAAAATKEKAACLTVLWFANLVEKNASLIKGRAVLELWIWFHTPHEESPGWSFLAWLFMALLGTALCLKCSREWSWEQRFLVIGDVVGASWLFLIWMSWRKPDSFGTAVLVSGLGLVAVTWADQTARKVIMSGPRAIGLYVLYTLDPNRIPAPTEEEPPQAATCPTCKVAVKEDEVFCTAGHRIKVAPEATDPRPHLTPQPRPGGAGTSRQLPPADGSGRRRSRV